MELEEALEIIEEALGSEFRHHLEEGLPDGAYEDWQHDSQLIKDIARSIQKWMLRINR
jgi:hypothetical protein